MKQKRLLVLSILVLILLVSSVSAAVVQPDTMRNRNQYGEPLVCRSDSECVSPRFCNPSTKQCSSACNSDAECGAPAYVCNSQKKCIPGCKVDANCGDANSYKCDTTSGWCVKREPVIKSVVPSQPNTPVVSPATPATPATPASGSRQPTTQSAAGKINARDVVITNLAGQVTSNVAAEFLSVGLLMETLRADVARKLESSSRETDLKFKMQEERLQKLAELTGKKAELNAFFIAQFSGYAQKWKTNSGSYSVDLFVTSNLRLDVTEDPNYSGERHPDAVGYYTKSCQFLGTNNRWQDVGLGLIKPRQFPYGTARNVPNPVDGIYTYEKAYIHDRQAPGQVGNPLAGANKQSEILLSSWTEQEFRNLVKVDNNSMKLRCKTESMGAYKEFSVPVY